LNGTVDVYWSGRGATGVWKGLHFTGHVDQDTGTDTPGVSVE